MSWEALPPRRSKRRLNEVPVANQEQQNDGVLEEQQGSSTLARSLLTSEDGCAGEFYECKAAYAFG